MLPKALLSVSLCALASAASQFPLLGDRSTSIIPELFAALERASRLADIAYCVSPPSTGISKPFKCLSRCADFPDFELLNAWNTGPLLSDSAGFLALDHGENGSGQIVLVFRGTYSIANALVDLSTVPQEYTPYPGQDDEEPDIANLHPHYLKRRTEQDRCINCTVHIGFNTAWHNTRDKIMPDLLAAAAIYPTYGTTLVGHSLGGAVAMLAALELQSRGFRPTVTTFGEPRVGNQGLADYLDSQFDLKPYDVRDTANIRYRRITHINDPIPLLPLTEWGFAMHAGEIFISKADLSPDLPDLQHCSGDNDPDCIAGQDSTVWPEKFAVQRLDLLASVKNELYDIQNEPWGIPSRYKLWQLFFAHRDYFHRIGLCVPGGDPLGGGHEYNDTTESE